MRLIRKTTYVALLGALLTAPMPAAAQTVQGQSLAGNWVRIDSNNDPNDAMRIRIDPNGAVLTFVPSTAGSAWQVGQLLWRAIQPSGALEVRGSDGNYYASTLSFKGPDVLDIDVQHTGAGHDQTWQRAGPTVDGDWEQIAPAGDPSDGTQVRAQGPGASIRYMPASAPRGYRIGRQLWQNISAGGAMQVLGSDGRYHPATVTLVGADSLRIDSSSSRVVSGQIWVRPGIVAAARAGLSAPPANPNQPGSGLQPVNPPPALPAPPSAPPPSNVACLATSLRHDQTGTPWGFYMTTPNRNDRQAMTIGIWPYFISSFQSTTRMPTDIDPLLLPAFGRGLSFVWQPQGSAGASFEERRDLTAAQYDQQDQAAHAAGLRAIDFEAYETPSGMRYAGVWAENAEGLSWRADYDQTNQQFGQAFPNLRNSGYRLVDIEAYETPNGIRYAGVWYRSCDNTNWREWRGMDRDSYQARVDSLSDLGFRVVDFESYKTSAGQRYAAIWERIAPGRGWAVRTDRDIKWFLNYHQQYVDEGMRLIDFESYDTPNGLRYAGVWAENDARYDFALRPILDDSILDYRDRHDIPGVSVVVMRGDEVIYRHGSGWADSVQQKSAHSGTIYITASISKIFGGTVAARLEDRGLIDLSRPTTDFLDDIGTHHTHTVEQLLSKTGCVWHYAQGPEPVEQYYRWRDSAIAQIQGSPLLSGCVPDRHYHYSTHGFTFVGGVLEEVTGKSIGQIMTDELSQPFGFSTMKLAGTTPLSGSSGPIPYYDLAQGYWWNPNAAQSRTVTYEDASWKVLGGGFQIDALDLARFGWEVLDGTIVSDSVRDNRLWMSRTNGAVFWSDTTSRAPGVGLAWVLRNVTAGGATRRVAEHGGAGIGGRSQLQVYRDDDITIAILTNQQNGPLTPGPNSPSSHPIRGFADMIADVVFSNLPPP